MATARGAALAFVEGYGRAWAEWDVERFVGLFSEDVRYVVHPSEETVRGRDALREYTHGEHRAQGEVSLRMGTPVIASGRAAAEFWVKSTGSEGEVTITGCFIARLDEATGECSEFREYWFETPGHTEPPPGWGS